jgi:outer membrane receptor protein involved in Fe transport
LKVFIAIACGLAMLLPPPVLADDGAVISEIVVTSQRRPQSRLGHAGNIDQLDAATLQRMQHHHISELLHRVPGAWIVRGSGQEHQTALRSPVLGGGGGCGAVLILEDGIPVRPASFCNINQLIEVNAEQARSVEVVRGPGNALFGSNALHGIINVIMPNPGEAGLASASVELGSNDFVRARASLPFAEDSPWLASLVLAEDGGFRDDSGYQQGKLHVRRRWLSADSDFTLALSATSLRQDTAGFIVGQNAYEDTDLRRTNPNPDAFRDANSLRLYGLWNRKLGKTNLDVRPYLRQSTMEFMHHGLPGQPIEENGQVSAGVITAASFIGPRNQTTLGFDIEWSDMDLEQTQLVAATGSPVQRETRPVGKHYDYSVVSLGIAPFVQSEHKVSDRVTVSGGVRFEYAHYDYRNHMLSGNTRDDGTPCGFSGCLYTRPDDRTDDFSNVAPNLAANVQLNATSSVFISLGRGFRAPQSLELYRLQNGQQVADLKSEQIDSYELGLRLSSERIASELVAFYMKKKDSVFRDAQGFNVNGARSEHRGVEARVDWQLSDTWRLNTNVAYARHTYDFDLVGRGESFVKGNDIDTAPRWLGSAELLFDPADEIQLGLQLTGVGSYYLEPGNRFRYSGHTLAHVRAARQFSPQWRAILRVNNLFDEYTADRADYAARDYRYLPGRGREAFIEFRYTPDL